MDFDKNVGALRYSFVRIDFNSMKIIFISAEFFNAVFNGWSRHLISLQILNGREKKT